MLLASPLYSADSADVPFKGMCLPGRGTFLASQSCLTWWRRQAVQCCVLQEALMNFVPPTLIPGVEGRFQAASAGGQFARFADSGTACGVWLPGAAAGSAVHRALPCQALSVLCPALCSWVPEPSSCSCAGSAKCPVPAVTIGPAVGTLLLVTTSPAWAQGTLVPRTGEGRCLQCFDLYFPGGKSLLGCRKNVEVRSYPAAAGARVQQWAGHQLGARPVPHRRAGCWCGGQPCPGLTWPYKSREESRL